MCFSSASSVRAVPFALLDRQLRLEGFRPGPLAYLADVHALAESACPVCSCVGLDPFPYFRAPFGYLGLGEYRLLAGCRNAACRHVEVA